MSRAPYSIPKPESAYPGGNLTAYDTTLGWRFPNKKMEALFPLEQMGETAENIYAEHPEITREMQDEFAFNSQRRAKAAIESGRFKDEIVPVTIPQRKGDPIVVDTDEHPRLDTTIDKLAKLGAAFRKGGTVTAGNASGINDGAVAVLLMSADKAKQLGLKPMARWIASAAAGVNPRTMGYGPIPATRKVLDRAGLKIEDIDLFELNEAFAVQALACARELGIPLDKLNVNGGAIALGHPLGCSGARLMTTLVHEMNRRQVRYGLATLCVGVGQGEATVIERVG
jgi:acetyl-CoA acetyltransferase family protein